jgi:catechol 2,3-dioxygenase-like lactoylglutathione lyase family enzyme
LTAEFSLGPIGQIAVQAWNIDRAMTFYRDTLGMRFLFQAPPGLGFSVIYYKIPDIESLRSARNAS